MNKLKCPGQDTRYWKPEDIFEVACSGCGKPVEFFKNDLKRSCPHCGRPQLNPKNDLSCAAWCAAAKECLEEVRQANEAPPPGQSGPPARS